jgi:multiple sugar transport system substrate-binding protein
MYPGNRRPCTRRGRIARTLALVCLLLLAACGGAAPTVAPATGTTVGATATVGVARTATPGTATGGATLAATGTARAAATASRATGAASPSATAARNPFGLAPGAGSATDGVQLNGPIALTFWHAQPPGVRDREIQRLIAGFQAQYPNITITSEYQGSTLFNKVRAAAIAGGTPDLITATEGQLTEYRAADLVAPLNDYANSSRYGLSAADLADFYPAYLAANEADGQLLALPFAKSVLGLYYNEDKLREAGVGVPETWDAFAAVCKKFTGGTKGYAIGISASTFMAMVYSRGGRLLDDGRTSWRFNEQPGQDQLALLQGLVASGCAYLVDKPFADQSDFGAGRAVFTIDASSGFSYYRDLVDKGGRFNWGLAALPHATGAAPATTLSGSNLTILRSTPERQLATWLFIEYATSRDATAGWAAATGYLPVRRSALQAPALINQLAAQPAYRVAVTVLPQTARPEPAIRGTTETRKFIEDALLIALSDPRRSPRELLDDAVRQANAASAQQR